jgi:hypothetical protein
VTDSYSGLIVPLPDLEPVVGPWRARYDAAVRDLPAHVAVLVPWLAPDELTLADEDAVAQLAKSWQPFSVGFTRMATFEATPGSRVDYLVPEPDGDFLALTEDLCTVWPECPPHGGSFGEPVPHLTVAGSATPEQAAALRGSVQAQLPLVTVAERLQLVVVRGGACTVRASFRLGGAKARRPAG